MLIFGLSYKTYFTIRSLIVRTNIVFINQFLEFHNQYVQCIHICIYNKAKWHYQWTRINSSKIHVNRAFKYFDNNHIIKMIQKKPIYIIDGKKSIDQCRQGQPIWKDISLDSIVFKSQHKEITEYYSTKIPKKKKRNHVSL